MISDACHDVTVSIFAKVNVVNIGGDWDWSFCPSFHVSVVPSVYMMTHNSSYVIALTAAQAVTPAITFPSLCEAALPSLSPFLVVLCSCRCCCICGCSSSSSNV